MSTQVQAVSAVQSGTFTLSGELPVHRLGYGAMRITGEGIWGLPGTGKRHFQSFGGPWNWASISLIPRTLMAPT